MYINIIKMIYINSNSDSEPQRGQKRPKIIQNNRLRFFFFFKLKNRTHDYNCYDN